MTPISVNKRNNGGISVTMCTFSRRVQLSAEDVREFIETANRTDALHRKGMLVEGDKITMTGCESGHGYGFRRNHRSVSFDLFRCDKRNGTAIRVLTLTAEELHTLTILLHYAARQDYGRWQL